MAFALTSHINNVTTVVHGAYIVELAARTNSSFLASVIRPHDGQIGQELAFPSFRTVKITFPNANAKSTADAFAQLSDHPDVQNISPVHSITTVPASTMFETADNIIPNGPDSSWSNLSSSAAPLSEHIMTQVNKLHDLNITGKGITVGIIDTGVDYTLPYLGKGCLGGDCLISRHVNFSPDECAKSPEDVMDCHGQGTSVASVLAMQQSPLGVGVSPGVQLAVYRLGNGTTTDDVVLAALHQAMEDHVPIVLLTYASAGLPFGQSPVSRAAVDLARADTAVIVGFGDMPSDWTTDVAFNGSENGKNPDIIAATTFKNTRKPRLVSASDDSSTSSESLDGSGGAVYFGSAWGPTFDMSVKPQFGAPGFDVLVAKASSLGGGFAIASGTALAAAHVAGAYALLAEVNNGKVDPKLFERRLSGTAQSKYFFDGEKLKEDSLAPVPQQGAGLVQVYQAAFAASTVSPASLSFNNTDSPDRGKPLEFVIHNQGDSQLAGADALDASSEPVTYNISYTPALTFKALNYYSKMFDDFPFNMTQVTATLQFNTSSVTLRKNAKAVVQVSASVPAELDSSVLPIWSGYINIHGNDGTRLWIPYQGMKGSLRNATVLRGTWRLRRSRTRVSGKDRLGANFRVPKSGVPSNSPSADPYPCPYLTFFINLVSAKVSVFALPETKAGYNGPGGEKHEREYDWKNMREVLGSPLEHSANQRGLIQYFEDGWCGQLKDGSHIPPGKYVFYTKALRINGDPNNDDHYDTAISKNFRITYLEDE